MAVISFRCGACKQVMRVGADKAGRKAKCTKCGKEVTIPKASPEPAEQAAPAAPAAAAAEAAQKKKQFSDDEDDDGAAYTFIEEPKPVEETKPKKKRGDDDEDEDEEEEEDEKKKQPKPVITRRKLKKKTVQFADEWMKFRISLVLVFAGMCGWLLIWLLHTVLVVLAFFDRASYGLVVGQAAQGGDVNMPTLAIGLLAGAAYVDIGNILFIIEQIVAVLSGAAFLGAFCVCLGVPNRFGSKGQAVALVVLSGVNLLLTVMFRLLPALGAIPYVMMPLIAPEAAMNEANVDRVLPIHAFWCLAPFWETFASVLILMLYYAEPIMFCIFMRAAALSMKDDEWLEPRALLLLRLGFGQFFILLSYYLLSLTGSSGVLQIVLFVAYAMWRSFLLGFLIWYAIITIKAKARVEYLLTAEEDEE